MGDPEPSAREAPSSGPARWERIGARAGGLAVRTAWMLAALLMGIAVQSVYHQPVGWAPKLVTTAVVLVSVMRPYRALLAVAPILPIATPVFRGIKTGSYEFDFAEALILAFLAGAAARRAIATSRDTVPARLTWSTAAFIATGLTSSVVLWVSRATEHPESAIWGLFPKSLVANYLIQTDQVTWAVRFLEGPLLLLVVLEICGGDRLRRTRVLQAIGAGAAAAVLFTFGTIARPSFAQAHPVQAFFGYFVGMRLSPLMRDANAIASYYAMMFFIAIGLTRTSRVAGAALSILCAAGLWMAGSRMALVAAFATACGAGLIAFGHSGWRRKAALFATLALVVAAGYGLWLRYPSDRNFGTAWWAFATRMELVDAALLMAESHPVFGVGIGQFYELSTEYAGDMLAAAGRGRENAHNYFAQIFAELGLVGIGVFLVLLAVVLREAWSDRRSLPVRWGLVAGLVVFLLTCLSGHPFLTPAVGCPFWMAAAAAVPATNPSAQRGSRYAGLALVALLVVTLPIRSTLAARHAYLEHTSVGLSLWQRDQNGVRFRWAGGRSTFYVPSAAKSIEIPLRKGRIGPDPLEVRILLDGHEATRVTLRASGEWSTLRLGPIRRASTAFSRVDLVAAAPGSDAPLRVVADNTSGALMVGRPTVHP